MHLTGIAPYVMGAMCQYTFYGGPWGLKVAAGESAASNPKWRGWMRYWAPGQTAAQMKAVDEDTAPETKTVAPSSLVKIYPNPASDVVNVNLYSDTEKDVRIHVTDVAGKTVFDLLKPVASGNNELTVDVSKLAKRSLHYPYQERHTNGDPKNHREQIR